MAEDKIVALFKPVEQSRKILFAAYIWSQSQEPVQTLDSRSKPYVITQDKRARSLGWKKKTCNPAEPQQRLHVREDPCFSGAPQFRVQQALNFEADDLCRRRRRERKRRLLAHALSRGFLWCLFSLLSCFPHSATNHHLSGLLRMNQTVVRTLFYGKP